MTADVIISPSGRRLAQRFPVVDPAAGQQCPLHGQVVIGAEVGGLVLADAGGQFPQEGGIVV